MNDFVPEAPEVGGVTTPTPIEDNKITPPSGGNKAEWNTCNNIAQLYNAGYTYFESSERQANGTFKYTLEIKNNQNQIAFTGKDADGKDISWSGELGMQGNQTYHVPNNNISLTYKLTERGIINFSPAGMNSYIKLYLAEKPKN